VPVEQSSRDTSRSSKAKEPAQNKDDDAMHLDDTKHKVYIYDLDAELSDSESDDGKLIFLPDIEKHLRESRIPPSVMANSEGELAGNKQLVLYNVPSSLTIPEEHDGVRKAIIEARARIRAKQEQAQNTPVQGQNTQTPNGSIHGGMNSPFGYQGAAGASLSTAAGASTTITPPMPDANEYDPDAMDLG
jgi:hypothetical protein